MGRATASSPLRLSPAAGLNLRSLFFRIFAVFWVAQSLIFIITTTVIVRRTFIAPEILSDALDSNLQHVAADALEAYDSGGCRAFQASTTRHQSSTSLLLNRQGRVLCSTSDTPFLPSVPLPFPTRIIGREVNHRYLWLVPVHSGAGTPLEYVWLQPPPSQNSPHRRGSFLQFAFPQLAIAIIIGGLTTFVLILLFSRPLVRLRKAARELAQGNLSARVEVPPRPSRSQPDDFQGLAMDFNDMAERLDALVGAQQTLLRDVSHELRSPLARLSVALELAREDSGPQLVGPLARIEREAERLNQLIGQLLTLSSLSVRRDVPHCERVSLNRICEAILPDAEYEAQQRPCAIVFVEQGECVLRGDWELLYRAIENVIRNAIRYTAENTQVTVRLLHNATERLAVLEVEDAGPGIPEEDLAYIFQPFYRVDRSRASSTGGFGVGLAITERSVKLHGGTIYATRAASGGACIRMTFPASPNHAGLQDDSAS